MSPPAYLDGLGFLGPRTLAVHGTWLTAGGLRPPGRNRDLAGAVPPGQPLHRGRDAAGVRTCLRAGVTLALGTDSLAGNWDLNLFGEMRWLHQNFPAWPGDLWLRLGTLNGARALGRDRDFGSLEPGKKAALGFVPLEGSGDFWGELFTAGAAGKLRWLG